jgi:hypothetical protein
MGGSGVIRCNCERDHCRGARQDHAGAMIIAGVPDNRREFMIIAGGLIVAEGSRFAVLGSIQRVVQAFHEFVSPIHQGDCRLALCWIEQVITETNFELGFELGVRAHRD